MASFLTPASLASRWSIAPNTLKQWRWNGRGPLYVKIGGRVLYRLADIEQFEEQKLRQHTSGVGL
jgi:predicted site-specific integrase-resolvase